MKKIYVVALDVDHVGKKKYAWEEPTQAQRIYNIVKAAGPDGVDYDGIVAALAGETSAKGWKAVSKSNLDFYINSKRGLVKNGFIVLKGSAAAVTAQQDANTAILGAMAALENALVARARELGITDKMRAEYATYKNIKARVLRPATDGEGAAALNVGMQRLVKLVLGQ